MKTEHNYEILHETPLGQFMSILGKVLSYLVMGLFALMTVYPLFWLVLNSFKSTQEFMLDKVGLPQALNFENYFSAWDIGEFAKLFPNSILYTVVSTLGIVTLSLLAGFAFAKISNRATTPIYASFVVGILLTTQSLLIPLFLEVNLFKIYDTRAAVLLVYIGSGIPVGVYLATEYIRSIPTALVESARLDGAGYFGIYARIILPLCLPVAMTLSILNITNIWNEFALINILVSSTDLKSLPLGIYKFSSSLSSDYGKQFAALVIGMAPMLIFYIAFRKQITKGVAAGAVKG